MTTEQIHKFEIADDADEVQVDNCIIGLRQVGYLAYRETGYLYTDAGVMGIAMVAGNALYIVKMD